MGSDGCKHISASVSILSSLVGEAISSNVYGSKILLKKLLFVSTGVCGLKKNYRKSLELPENPVSITALSQFI